MEHSTARRDVQNNTQVVKRKMLAARGIGKVVTFFAMAPLLMACDVIGPRSISVGRMAYNDVLQRTSKEQLFSNIVRVATNEPPLFVDVTEIDASVLGQASLTAGVAGLGAIAGKTGGTLAGTTGSFGGSLEYQEAPIIRYQPLQGQALVAQISSPISVDSISFLFDSDWPLASILTFTTDRLTPSYRSYASALNAIIELDQYGALILAPGKSSLTKRTNENQSGSDGHTVFQIQAAPSTSANDSLLVFLEPAHPYPLRQHSNLRKQPYIQYLWTRLLGIYAGTQPASSASGQMLELRNLPVSDPAKKQIRDRAPFLRTRSALGILRTVSPGAVPSPEISIVSPATFLKLKSCDDRFQRTRRKCWNDGQNFYTAISGWVKCVNSQTLEETDCDYPKEEFSNNVKKQVDEWIQSHAVEDNPDFVFTIFPTSPVDGDDENGLELETRLQILRRYILVVESNTLPTNAFVWRRERGHYFYVDGDDFISQKNLALLNQILIMEAIAPSPPLTPTLPVGGR